MRFAEGRKEAKLNLRIKLIFNDLPEIRLVSTGRNHVLLKG